MATNLFRAVLDDPTTLQSAAAATGNGTALDVRGYPTAVVQVTGASPLGTITFEGTVDGTNFVSVEAINIATGVAATTTTAVGVFLLPVAGLERIRARISVFTSGTWTVVGRGILADTASVALTTAGGGGGTVTANQGTANAAGAASWPVQGAGASAAAKAGNPVQTGGIFNTAQPTVTNGQTVEQQSTARGAAIVATGVDVFTVDTELPAAAALSDTLANPTTPQIGANELRWDSVGSQWVRAASGNNGKAFASAVLGLTPAQMLINDSSTSQQINSARNVSDGGTGSTTITSAPFLANAGATGFDFQRGNLASATVGITAVGVTSTQTGSDQTNRNHRGVKVVLDMTTVGTGSVTLTIQGKDEVSGKYYTLLAGAAVITNSTNVYTVYPGVTAAANVSASDILPRTWRVLVTANNANATTYTVGASLIV